SPLRKRASSTCFQAAEVMEARRLLSASAVGAVHSGHSAAAPPAALLHDFGTAASVFDLGSTKNGDELWEVANSTTGHTQLWKSNGTPSGTTLLHDFGAAAYFINRGTAGNGNTLFEVDSGTTYD